MKSGNSKKPVFTSVTEAGNFSLELLKNPFSSRRSGTYWKQYYNLEEGFIRLKREWYPLAHPLKPILIGKFPIVDIPSQDWEIIQEIRKIDH